MGGGEKEDGEIRGKNRGERMYTSSSQKPVELLVGARGFEPPTSASRTLRANQAALRPDSLYYKPIDEVRQV